MSLALLVLRELLKVLGCLKQLLAGLVDRDLLDNGPDFLRLPAILGSFLKTSTDMVDRHMRNEGISASWSTWIETVTVRTGCRCSSFTSTRMSSEVAPCTWSNRSRVSSPAVRRASISAT